MKWMLYLYFVASASANVLHRQSYRRNGFNPEEFLVPDPSVYFPFFFPSVSATGRSEFFKISSNTTIPRSQIETQLNQWAIQNGVQSQWNALVTKFKAEKEDIIQNVRQIVNGLPELFEKFVQVQSNMNLSQQEALSQAKSGFDYMKPYVQNIKNSISDVSKLFTLDRNSVFIEESSGENSEFQAVNGKIPSKNNMLLSGNVFPSGNTGVNQGIDNWSNNNEFEYQLKETNRFANDEGFNPRQPGKF